MTTIEKTSHKLGANRNELTHTPRRSRSTSESRDVREDRGVRQSKLAQPQRPALAPIVSAPRTTPVARRVTATGPSLLTEHAAAPKPKPAHVRFRREGVRSVFVAGTFNDWEPQRLALRADNKGGWETELVLPPGDYEYRFFVDGEWTDDPLACRVVPNPYGGVNAVLHVHGS